VIVSIKYNILPKTKSMEVVKNKEDEEESFFYVKRKVGNKNWELIKTSTIR